MNIHKQISLLEILVSSKDVFNSCIGILDSNYFDPKIRQLVSFILEYHEKYNAIPDIGTIKIESGFELKPQEITYDLVEYCKDEVEKFCKRSAMIGALRECIPMISMEGEGPDDAVYGKVEQLIKGALQVSLDHDIGLDYFRDPLDRLESMLAQDDMLPTGIKEFDKALGGGPARTNIILMSANSGVGKSVTMNNLCIRHLKRGLNVLYISLELGELQVGQRSDVMMTGIPSIPREQWEGQIRNIARAVEEVKNEVCPDTGSLPGTFTIKRMPAGSTPNEIRAYLKHYQLVMGYLPDVIGLDYLDLVDPNGRVRYNNVSDKDKAVTEQIREICFEVNCLMYTASQQNRGAIDADIETLSQGNIAGGLTKVNTVDVYFAITSTAIMKAQGQIGFTFLKSRNSDATGKTIMLSYCPIRLWIDDAKGDFTVMRNQDTDVASTNTRQQRSATNSLEALLSKTARKNQ